MTKEEANIGARMMQVRHSLHCPRRHLAHLLGVAPPVIKRIELGRALLRFELAQHFCERFDINQAWLAGALAPQQPALRIHDHLKSIIPRKMPFWQAFDLFIRPHLKGLEKALASAVDSRVRTVFEIGAPRNQQTEERIKKEIAAAVKGVPGQLHLEFWDSLSERIDEFCKAHGLKRRIAGDLKPSYWKGRYMVRLSEIYPIKEPFDLTEAETQNKTPEVIAQMSTLRERLERATAMPGKKTELANALNPRVPLASISRWLSGEREPGGEMALQLLAWVQAEEAKKENASAVTSSAGAKKTRMKNHHETKPHPSPKSRYTKS